MKKLFASTLAALLMAVPAFAAPVSVSADLWPVWPEPSQKINDLAVREPATFLSIGRDVIAWPFFDPTTVSGSRVNLLGCDLFFTVGNLDEDGEMVFETITPDSFSGAEKLFLVWDNTLHSNPDNQDIIDALRDVAVFPEYRDGWLNSTPNEGLDPGASIAGWKIFLTGRIFPNSPEKGFFADCGHAPPHMVWPEDPWLKGYGVGGYSAPVKWKDRTACLWPTNQGGLQGFEIAGDAFYPYADRTWIAVPAPALQQSIYHEVRKAYHGSSYRLTVLDGPVTVRDVEIGGEWRRVAVGTTGIGTRQGLKPSDAWNKLGQNTKDTPSPVPTMQDPGRIFGVYAIDITDLEPSAASNTIVPLWSVTASSFTTSAAASSGVQVENGGGGGSYSAFGDLKFSVSKPLIGYTVDGSGNRHWHAVLLGVDSSNRYKWLDLDIADGSVRRSGYFQKPGGSSESISSEYYVELGGNLTGEEMEILFPSRILSAFPPPGSGYDEPLLSDIYVYLSNGAFYRLSLNDPGSSPQWIFTFVSKADKIVPPTTDFDISYKGGETFLASTVFLSPVSGQAAHDTDALLLINISEIEGIPANERTVKVPPGQGGGRAESEQTFMSVVQLEYVQGSNEPAEKVILASPVFVMGKVYVSFYELNKQKNGKIKSMVTRLYGMDFSRLMTGGGKIDLKKGDLDDQEQDDDYYDILNKEAVMMMVDSSGRLVLLDAEGNVMASLATGLGGLGGEPGENDGETPRGVRSVYWKID